MTDPKHVSQTCVLKHVRHAARAVTALYEEALAPVDLTASQFTTLVAVSQAGPVAHGPLARLLGMDRTTLTRVLKGLTDRGLVAAVPDPEDRRARAIRLTDPGRATLERALPLWDRAQARALERIGPERWHGLRRDLSRLAG